MKTKVKISLQEMAIAMREIKYSDNHAHHLGESLSVIHPNVSIIDGINLGVGFSGGIWTDCLKLKSNEKYKSLSFSFNEIKGITNFTAWVDDCEIRYSFGDKPTLEEFKEVAIKLFGIENLYEYKIK